MNKKKEETNIKKKINIAGIFRICVISFKNELRLTYGPKKLSTLEHIYE